MNSTQADLEQALRAILEKRIIDVEPPVGCYGWICFAKSIPLDQGKIYYKIGNTGRLETHLSKINKDPLLAKDTPPLVLKIWGGPSYFIKVIRRIFKDKRRNPSAGRNGWYELSETDISWLSKFELAQTNNLESDVYALFDQHAPSFVARLRQEGLW